MRDVVGASWRSRWNSFHLDTPNHVTLLPDSEAPGKADAFLPRDEWVGVMDAYRAKHELPIREGVEVGTIRGSEAATRSRRR